jgi:hypothetical protein
MLLFLGRTMQNSPVMNRLARLATALAAFVFLLGVSAQLKAPEAGARNIAARINLLDDPSFFPLAVWVQQPRNAARFKAAGINLYVGLWRGPTAEQLDAIARAGLHVVCSQNAFALANKTNSVIAAWMHGDEPDNAQALRGRDGWGPPILPSVIESDYKKMKTADPTRPILLNLGQGVAWDNWIGRGVRRNHPEDYPEYVKGCDIASFDIYPVVHDNAEVAGKLEFVAKGVQRLREWTKGEKRIWNCIECTRISNPDKKASPDQIRSEAWMSIIHGSRGIIYFIHQFKPAFIEAALLEDPENLAAVTALNAQIKELAPVINSPELRTAVSAESEGNVRVATSARKFKGSIYLFTVAMENKATSATFKFPDLPESGTVEVIGESRSIAISNRAFTDQFKPYEVHLYRFAAAQ